MTNAEYQNFNKKKKRNNPFKINDGKTTLFSRHPRGIGGPQGFQNLLIVPLVVVVILESRSPGSVVTQKEENNRYWNAPRRQTFQYDPLFL